MGAQSPQYDLLKRILSILFLVLATTGVMGQNFTITQEVDSFSVDIRNNLSSIHTSKASRTAEGMEALWPNLSAVSKNAIINQIQQMNDRDYPIKPVFVDYFTTIDLAKTKALIDETTFNQLVETTGKVIENHTQKELMAYLNSIELFFESEALFLSSSNQVRYHNGSYGFVYHGAAELASIDEDFYEEEPEEEAPEDADYEEDDEYYDDEYYDDEYYDDDYEDDYSDEEYEEEPEEDLIEYFPDPSLPLAGPVITFSNVNLELISPRKQSVIKNTKGDFLILQRAFSGEGGTMDWTAGGIPDASISLQTYNFDVHRPNLIAKVVTLTYPEKLAEPIQGELNYNGEQGPAGSRFVSYRSDIQHSNQGVAGLVLTGGFSLVGDKIGTRTKMKKPAYMRLTRDGVNVFRTRAREFIVEDSTVQGKGTRVSLYHGQDSIYHSSAELKFDTRDNNLVVKSVDGNYRYAPFYSSFVNMEITADMVAWDLDSDSLEISILSGKAEIPSLIQSVEYYSSEVLSSLSRNYNFNPVMIVTNYVSRKHVREFYPGDIANYHNLNAREVGNAMKELARYGYLEYDPFTGLYAIKKKAVHYNLAKRNKVDYDNLLLLSKVNTGPNIVFDMANSEMHVNGIEKFYISEVLDVYILPDSNRITLGNDREFLFNGKLFAGNFEYDGSGFRFNYDSFYFDLQQIDQIQLYTQGEDSKKSKIENVISGISDADSAVIAGMSDFQGTSGKLYVNRPDNKSGKKIFPNYPKFEGGGSGFVVYFNGQEYLEGVYGKSLYMVVPPFNLDSLSDSDPAAINFRGTFSTSDIMPDFSEMLHIMPDQTLGFEHSIPPEGYPLFEGDGRIFNKLSMDGEGLRSTGEMAYMTSSFFSDSYVFFPDSIVADGTQFVMKPEAYNDLIFPDIKADVYRMKWLTGLDSMHLDNVGDPFSLYEGIAVLDGRTTITHRGVFGSGDLNSLGSETYSDAFEFKSERFLAKNAQFKINTDNPEKPALAGNDVHIDFDLVTKKAEIKPEVEGEAALEFPYAQFRTSIPTAVWDLDSGIVTMSKPENIDIESSYFYTTREDLDSLRFNATTARYNMNTQELLVSGIPYITVADAEITPENGEVLVLENSRIGTLTNTTIVIDTLNGYHRLYDGTIDVISRNEFAGSATYEYVNAVQDTFAIKMEDFHLEQVGESKKRSGLEQQTVATGTVSGTDSLLASPGIFYKGSITMRARKPALELDGYVKLDLKKVPSYDTWIQYASDAEQQEVIIDFNNDLTEFGGHLVAGLHFDYNDYSLYHTFIQDKREVGDEDFFRPSGKLRYFPDSAEYVIIDTNKELGLNYDGKMLVYNEDSAYMYLEGPINLLEANKSVTIDAAAIGSGNTETMEFDFNAMLAIDFGVNPGVFDLMAQGFLEAIELVGAPEGVNDRASLLVNLANIAGDRAAKNYEELSIEEYTPLGPMSSKLIKPITVSEVNLKWSPDQRAFYNDGGTMGISNVLRNDINARFETFFEIRKGVDGDKIDLFIKASPEFWYYFSYQDNKMLIYSSDNAVNDFVKQKSNQGKAKISDFVFAPGDIGETQAFVNTFRRIYYGIKEPYDLGAEVKVEDKDKEKVTDDDDDEGF